VACTMNWSHIRSKRGGTIVSSLSFRTKLEFGKFALPELHAPHDWKYTHPVISKKVARSRRVSAP
jgi:hypothetical protein